jgi:UDP-glucuronate 4-epimerase
MKILVTGAAGFIGFHTCIQLLKEHHVVIGIDNLNDYYEIQLKLDRLKELGISLNDDLRILQIVESRIYTEFQFINLDITHSDQILSLMRKEKFDLALHLAAQAGVRYSIENPGAYIQANISGFYSIIEGCRRAGISKIVYASSSSVYGNTKEIPFHEGQQVDRPVSLYAATKKCNELVAHTYSHLYNISAIGLRFFTVYGPWGRPDMAPFLFTKAILDGKPINVFNNGDLRRDFTYIDDIVAGISGVVNKQCLPGSYKIFNIGNNKPEKLMDFINLIEKYTGKKAIINMLPMQAGDVYQTFADTSSLNAYCGYEPIVSLSEGMNKFISWYKSYYSLNK